jgi:transcription antitermination factor NusG
VLLPEAVERRPLAKPHRGVFTWKGPLFPTYLFAAFDPEREWLWINDLFGVSGVIVQGERPVPVRPAAIERLLAEIEAGGGAVKLERCAKGARRRFEKGDQLRVTGGAFTSFAGPYIEHRGGKVILDLDIFSRRVRVELSEALVTAA